MYDIINNRIHSNMYIIIYRYILYIIKYSYNIFIILTTSHKEDPNHW